MSTRVLVGIPTLNGNHRLLRCLKSIFESTKLDGVRVLVADDGSTDEELKLNKDVISQFSHNPRVEMLYGQGRTGIAKTWNRLCRQDKEWGVAVLVNDDIEVVPDWLDVLEYSVRNNQHAGMVGLNSYLGVTKEQARVAYGRVFPDLHGKFPLQIDYHEAKLMNGGGNLLASTGSCFAFRRDVYELVGGFDERYFVFFEEVDFGVSLQRAGFYNYMASYPLVYHTGGETNSDEKNLKASERISESMNKFREKWGKTPSELRAEFMQRPAPPVSKEWNTMVRNLT